MQLATKVVWLSLALILLPPTAGAFEKQQLPAAGAPNSAAAKPEAPAPLAPAERATVPNKSGGTAINIPGLGQVGVIPKLDFGMELLYGSEPKPNSDPLPKEEDEGLQIRGTIKHRF